MSHSTEPALLKPSGPISVEYALFLQTGGAQLVDVRELDELPPPIEGALRIPLENCSRARQINFPHIARSFCIASWVPAVRLHVDASRLVTAQGDITASRVVSWNGTNAFHKDEG
jgi:rhodanese-related sulfurtransferase